MLGFFWGEGVCLCNSTWILLSRKGAAQGLGKCPIWLCFRSSDREVVTLSNSNQTLWDFSQYWETLELTFALSLLNRAISWNAQQIALMFSPYFSSLLRVHSFWFVLDETNKKAWRQQTNIHQLHIDVCMLKKHRHVKEHKGDWIGISLIEDLF